MFITNHVLSGALIGRALSDRPVVAFVAGLASHLALDAVPHWGCDLTVAGGPEHFLRVARRDGLLGLAAVAVTGTAAGRGARTATLAAIGGAVLLDLDKPCLHFFGVDPFPELVGRVHGWVQNESPKWMPVEFAAGALLAMADGVLASRSSVRDRAQRR